MIQTANDETVLILQMESVEHYEQVDDILAIDDFDVLFVGPMDLSASLGVTAAMLPLNHRGPFEMRRAKLHHTGRDSISVNDCPPTCVASSCARSNRRSMASSMGWLLVAAQAGLAGVFNISRMTLPGPPIST